MGSTMAPAVHSRKWCGAHGIVSTGVVVMALLCAGLDASVSAGQSGQTCKVHADPSMTVEFKAVFHPLDLNNQDWQGLAHCMVVNGGPAQETCTCPTDLSNAVQHKPNRCAVAYTGGRCEDSRRKLLCTDRTYPEANTKLGCCATGGLGDVTAKCAPACAARANQCKEMTRTSFGVTEGTIYICVPLKRFVLACCPDSVTPAGCTGSGCSDGEYKKWSGACAKKRTSCPAGQRFTAGSNVVTTKDDTACTECADGQFKDSATTCAAKKTSCGNGQYLTAGSNSERTKDDTTCPDCKTCPADEFKAGGCSGTSDATCTPCSGCAAGRYQSGGCSGSSDAVCSACSNINCPSGTYRSGSCSGTTNGFSCCTATTTAAATTTTVRTTTATTTTTTTTLSTTTTTTGPIIKDSNGAQCDAGYTRSVDLDDCQVAARLLKLSPPLKGASRYPPGCFYYAGMDMSFYVGNEDGDPNADAPANSVYACVAEGLKLATTTTVATTVMNTRTTTMASATVTTPAVNQTKGTTTPAVNQTKGTTEERTPAATRTAHSTPSNRETTPTSTQKLVPSTAASTTTTPFVSTCADGSTAQRNLRSNVVECVCRGVDKVRCTPDVQCSAKPLVFFGMAADTFWVDGACSDCRCISADQTEPPRSASSAAASSATTPVTVVPTTSATTTDVMSRLTTSSTVSTTSPAAPTPDPTTSTATIIDNETTAPSLPTQVTATTPGNAGATQTDPVESPLLMKGTASSATGTKPAPHAGLLTTADTNSASADASTAPPNRGETVATPTNEPLTPTQQGVGEFASAPDQPGINNSKQNEDDGADETANGMVVILIISMIACTALAGCACACIACRRNSQASKVLGDLAAIRRATLAQEAMNRQGGEAVHNATFVGPMYAEGSAQFDDEFIDEPATLYAEGSDMAQAKAQSKQESEYEAYSQPSAGEPEYDVFNDVLEQPPVCSNYDSMSNLQSAPPADVSLKQFHPAAAYIASDRATSTSGTDKAYNSYA